MKLGSPRGKRAKCPARVLSLGCPAPVLKIPDMIEMTIEINFWGMFPLVLSIVSLPREFYGLRTAQSVKTLSNALWPYSIEDSVSKDWSEIEIWKNLKGWDDFSGNLKSVGDIIINNLPLGLVWSAYSCYVRISPLHHAVQNWLSSTHRIGRWLVFLKNYLSDEFFEHTTWN